MARMRTHPSVQNPVVRNLHKIFIGVAGGTVVLTGIALLALPGPGGLVVFGGLAILGAEFAWARRLQRKAEAQAHTVVAKAQKIRRRRASLRARRPTGPRVDVPTKPGRQ